LLDNAPGHPPNLEDVKSELEVKIVFLAPNTTSVLQAMDQGVTNTFKAYQCHQTLQETIQQMDTSEVSLKEYWKDYNILKAIDDIKNGLGRSNCVVYER
jgi:septum formation inhibitor-activating ATPase MinD